MEEGSMRCDVNVSVRKPGEPLGTRCEIKNVNSVRFVMQAIEHEARRQVEVSRIRRHVVQETRLFDPNRGETRSMRSKEDAHDYRYFPDPDLLPLELDDGDIARVRATLPELPDAKKARFIERVRPRRPTTRRAGRRAGDRRLFRGGGQGPRCQAGRQLGDRASSACSTS
jgi:aspartyl-tRNA(Asn)/glutamyl-tRNA(Gln) amidotransferase subunit B